MDKLTEAQILRSLYDTYLNMNEAAKGRAGGYASDADDGKGNPQGKAVGGGWTGTRQTGLGRNYKGNKTTVKNKYERHLKRQKERDEGISSADRRERARQNKENSSKAKLDDLLKDIRGK